MPPPEYESCKVCGIGIEINGGHVPRGAHRGPDGKLTCQRCLNAGSVTDGRIVFPRKRRTSATDPRVASPE